MIVVLELLLVYFINYIVVERRFNVYNYMFTICLLSIRYTIFKSENKLFHNYIITVNIIKRGTVCSTPKVVLLV